jgi:phosphatidate cytidylyltransferase
MVSFFLSTIVLWYMNYTFILALFLSISLFFGDIYFSYIKRKLNLKDFSNTLGNHGGILDRLDSMFLITIIITFISYNL